MPRPEGWTAEMEERRDRCTRDLVREGLPAPKTQAQREQSDRSRAYAICTAAIEHTRKGGNPDGFMEFAREVVKSLRELLSV